MGQGESGVNRGRRGGPRQVGERVVWAGSTPEETFRATVQAHTPDGGFTTVIVTRQGLGHRGRTWLTFDGGIKTTAVFTDEQADQLVCQLSQAGGYPG